MNVHDNLLVRVAVWGLGAAEEHAVERTPVLRVIVGVVGHGTVHPEYDTQPSSDIIRYTPVRAQVLGLYTNSLADNEPTHRHDLTLFRLDNGGLEGIPDTD